MEVADGPYNTQQITSNDSSRTPPTDVRMSLALPGKFPPSNLALVGPERAHVCTSPDNSTVQTTIPASERWTSPSHGVASGKEIAFYRDGERSSRDTGFEVPSNGEGVLLHMAKITLELLRELSTTNSQPHVKTTTGQQRRFHRFAQKAHRARRWIYRSVQQTGSTMARQQIQMLEQGLDGQAELSPVAGDAGTLWALTQRCPLRVPIPSALALVMRFLPEGVKRSINLRDRADVARVFVALVNRWLSEAGGEGALTTRGTTRQLASAEKSGKIVEVEYIMG